MIIAALTLIVGQTLGRLLCMFLVTQSSQPYEVTAIIPILQMRKLRLGESVKISHASYNSLLFHVY